MSYLNDEDDEDYLNEGSRNIPGLLLKVFGKMSFEKYKILK